MAKTKRHPGYVRYLAETKASNAAIKAAAKAYQDAKYEHWRVEATALETWFWQLLQAPTHKQQLAHALTPRPSRCPMCGTSMHKREAYEFHPPLGGVLAWICQSCWSKCWRFRYVSDKTSESALVKRLQLTKYSYRTSGAEPKPGAWWYRPVKP